MPGLSNTAVTVRLPAASTPSMLSSGPGRYSSMSRGSPAGRSASSRTCRIRWAASTAAAGWSARSTPWLALRDTALTTHGKPTAAAPSPFLRGEERLGPRLVVGDVDEPGHLGQAGPQQRLDALPEGDLGQAAALAAAFEADPDPAVGDAGHGHPAVVGGDRRVDG